MTAYCIDEDVKKICPKAMRVDPDLLTEIATYIPIAQAYINDYLAVDGLQGIIPENVKSSTALMTCSLMLSNPFTKYNTQEIKDEKVISLAQLKESQALKLIKNLAKGSYINNDLIKPLPETSPFSYISISTNEIRNIVDGHIKKVSRPRFI